MKGQIFRRVEQKYMLTKEQYKKLLEKIKNHLEKDYYYKSTICNIYFDTDNDDLIVNSLEKPIYKEKLRLRSYGIPTLDSIVYLEIKSKLDGVVGKRRVPLTLKEFYNYLDNKEFPKTHKQIMNEIDYCFNHYDLKPKLFLAYDRLSYYDKNDINFRITFDTNIRSRYEDLKLEYGDAGKLLFKEEKYVMELKALDALPLWFTSILSSLKIYPISFSKYGSIHTNKIKEELNYV